MSMMRSLSVGLTLVSLSLSLSLSLGTTAAVAGVAVEGDAPWFCHGIDCPRFDHTTTTQGTELRQYAATKWVTTVVEGISLDAAEHEGFMRLFQYISGKNKAGRAVKMTAPVLNHVVPGAGPNCNSTFKISFFVPFNEQAAPPAPSDPRVFIESMDAVDVAVGEFGRKAAQSEVVHQASALADRVQADESLELGAGKGFFFAGYDPPFRLTNRHNEIWLPIARKPAVTVITV